MRSRKYLVDSIRGLLRLVNTKPFSDNDVFRVIEYGIDDFSNRCPFAMAVDRTHGVKGQRELILPIDVLEVIEVHYMDTAGSTLADDITSDSPANGGNLIVNTPVTDFPTSGVLLIDNEEIGYTDTDTTQFKNITRGMNNTTAAAHTQGSKVIEAGKQFKRLEPRSTRQIGNDDQNYLSASSGVPEYYYVFSGVLGMDKPFNKTGMFNVVLRNFIRPPSLTNDDAVITSLLASFNKAIVSYGASILAQELAQDDASLKQATMWMQSYLADIAQFKSRQHQYTPGAQSQIYPAINRPTGFK